MNLFRKMPPWLLLLLCALYILSPIDLIPDFLGLPGRLDDLLVALVTLYYLYSGSGRIPGGGTSRGERGSSDGRHGRREQRESEGASSSERTARDSTDPYQVLGVGRGEDFEKIRRRYRERLLQYHPDRVQHLGKEFQEMAERKTREITDAYQRILRERKRASR